MSKLISTNYFCLLVYQTKEAVDEVADRHAAVGGPRIAPTTAADYWSKKLGCQVWCSELDDVFLVLEEDKDKKLLKVLHGSRVGWIIALDWIGLEEVKQ